MIGYVATVVLRRTVDEYFDHLDNSLDGIHDD